MPRCAPFCLLLLAAALGACAQRPPQVPLAPPPPMIAPGQCNEGAAQHAVGRVVDARLAEDLRARASAQHVRLVRPGEMVTMEFDAGRLTLELDANDRIVRARCG